MRDQETDREGMAYQSLVDLPLNQSRSSQLSCLGSGIPSLVGAFDSKKCGAGSSLSTSSGEREDVIQLDLQGEEADDENFESSEKSSRYTLTIVLSTSKSMFGSGKSSLGTCFIEKNRCIREHVHPSWAWGRCSKSNQNNLLP